MGGGEFMRSSAARAPAVVVVQLQNLGNSVVRRRAALRRTMGCVILEKIGGSRQHRQRKRFFDWIRPTFRIYLLLATTQGRIIDRQLACAYLMKSRKRILYRANSATSYRSAVLSPNNNALWALDI